MSNLSLVNGLALLAGFVGYTKRDADTLNSVLVEFPTPSGGGKAWKLSQQEFELFEKYAQNYSGVAIQTWEPGKHIDEKGNSHRPPIKLHPNSERVLQEAAELEKAEPSGSFFSWIHPDALEAEGVQVKVVPPPVNTMSPASVSEFKAMAGTANAAAVDPGSAGGEVRSNVTLQQHGSFHIGGFDIPVQTDFTPANQKQVDRAQAENLDALVVAASLLKQKQEAERLERLHKETKARLFSAYSDAPDVKVAAQTEGQLLRDEFDPAPAKPGSPLRGWDIGESVITHSEPLYKRAKLVDDHQDLIDAHKISVDNALVEGITGRNSRRIDKLQAEMNSLREILTKIVNAELARPQNRWIKLWRLMTDPGNHQ